MTRTQLSGPEGIVLDQRRPGRFRGRRSVLGSAVTVLLLAPLLLAFAIPTLGAAAKKLSDPSVSPRDGTTNTTIVFEVTYTRPMEPEFVRVVIAGKNHAMAATSGGTWTGEGRFRYAGKLPAGTHSILFQGAGVKDLPAGSVTITVPPTPKPTPAPTPRPTPRPTAVATATPTPSPSTAAGPSATPAVPTPPIGSLPPPGSSDAPSATPSPAAPSASASPAVVTGVLPGGPLASAPPGGPGGESLPLDPAGDGPSAGPWLPEAAALAAIGLDRGLLPALSMPVTLVTTTGGVAAMAMAFSLFGKRRRDDEAASDPTLGDRAGQGVGVLDGAVAAAVAAAVAQAPPDAEADMPRWRRPSLLQARKADPIRDGVEAARLTFDNGLIGPIEGRERRLIKYDVVTLLDAPDEVRGNGIGVLTQGDEIQLLERRGVYWHVLCPDGSQGWVHKMTVGEIVGESKRPDGARATMPTVAESWTMGEDDIDDDVLSAYLAARRLE